MQNTTSAAQIEEASTPSDAATKYKESLRSKILFGLSVYPFVNPSMLHVFMGTSTPTSIWKDEVLEELIQEGLVVKEDVQLTSPSERSQTYTVLHLAEREYTPPNVPPEVA